MTDTERLWAASRARAHSHHAILGGRLPTIGDLFLGSPFLRGSAELDYQHWHDGLKIDAPEVAAALARARVRFDRQHLHALLLSLEGNGDPAWSHRVLVYAACAGDVEARRRLVHVIVAICGRSGVSIFWNSVVLGLLTASATSMADFYGEGIKRLEALRDEMVMYGAGAQTGIDHFDHEDRVEFFSNKETGASGEPSAGEQLVRALLGGRPSGGRVVVPVLSEGSGVKKEINKSFSPIAGKRLPLTPLRDLTGVRRRLCARWPHAAATIDAMLRDLATSEYVRMGPVLLVGTPGSGKSALAQAICTELGIPMHVIGLGGAADSSLGGTSAQWHSARPSVVLQHILADRSATIGIVWDEVDKASPDRRNGSAFDSLLPLLEVDQARRFRDPALEVEVDLSHVTHLATANMLADVPAPLKDRMRILHVPTPEWQHVGPLVEGIAADIMTKRGMSAWHAPLGQDEMAVLEGAWQQSPSFRSFRRVVSDLLVARETLWGRA
jgi:hypothetical protein